MAWHWVGLVGYVSEMVDAYCMILYCWWLMVDGYIRIAKNKRLYQPISANINQHQPHQTHEPHHASPDMAGGTWEVALYASHLWFRLWLGFPVAGPVVPGGPVGTSSLWDTMLPIAKEIPELHLLPECSCYSQILLLAESLFFVD